MQATIDDTATTVPIVTAHSRKPSASGVDWIAERDRHQDRCERGVDRGHTRPEEQRRHGRHPHVEQAGVVARIGAHRIGGGDRDLDDGDQHVPTRDLAMVGTDDEGRKFCGVVHVG